MHNDFIVKKTRNTIDYDTYIFIKERHDENKKLMDELRSQYTYWEEQKLDAEYGGPEYMAALYSLDALIEQMRSLAREIKEEEECIKFFEEQYNTF